LAVPYRWVITAAACIDRSVDITAEIVAAFREEVIMLARLARHPNVVQVMMMMRQTSTV
jgi:hypothetical protein